MRRIDRCVTDFEEVKQVISHCDVIRLGLSDEPCPYIVPLNFGYEFQGEQIFFYLHSALVGRKVELLQKQNTVFFEMDAKHQLEHIESRHDLTMRYECLMGTAKAEFLQGEEKERALSILVSRYNYPDFTCSKEKIDRVLVTKLTVLDWSCKINRSPKK